MCGLFGIASRNLSQNDKKLFYTLGVLSTFRGVDSTGVIAIKGYKPEIVTHKTLNTPSEFFKRGSTQAILSPREVNVLIGHNRAATLGSVNLENAQPITVGSLYGVHNGTVRGFEDTKDDISDSIGLYNKIYSEGLETTLKECERKFGAYALVWYDLNDDTINFVRNSKRTLFLCHSAHTMFWSSEKDFIKFALDRCDLYKYMKVEEVPVHTLIKIPRLSIGQRTQRTLDVKKPEIVHTIGARREAWQGWPGMGRNDTPFVNDNGEKKERQKDTTPKHIHAHQSKGEELSKKEEGQTAKLSKRELKKIEKEARRIAKKVSGSPNYSTHFHTPDGYIGFKGESHSLNAAETLLGEGCSNCTHEPTINDIVWWFKGNEFVCEPCKKDLIRNGMFHDSQIVMGYPIFLHKN